MIDVLADITDEQFARPTPCTKYTVADVIDHVDFGAVQFTALGRYGDGEQSGTDAGPAATQRGPGWQDFVTEHVRALGKAWGSPEAWQGSTTLAGIELSNELWGTIALTEVVVHGWDLARATDQTVQLPEETLQACFDHVSDFVPKAPFPELWAPPVDVGPDHTLLDRIVAITGRSP